MYEGSKVARWENSEVARLQRWEGSEVVRWERWETSEVARIKVLVIFKGGMQGPRFHLFISDVNQRKEGAGHVQDILAWRRDGKILLRSHPSC